MSDPRAPTNLRYRWAARTANVLIDATFGFRLAFIEEGMRTHGVVGFSKTFLPFVEVFKDLQTHFGVVEGQLVMAFAAFWEGCTYCSRGHLLTSNLARFRTDGVVFPLHVDDLIPMQEFPDDEVLTKLRGALGDHPQSLALIERQFLLRAELAAPEGSDDDLLQASIAAWNWITDCTIMLSTDVPVEPLARGLDDPDLRERYNRAVAEARSVA